MPEQTLDQVYITVEGKKVDIAASELVQVCVDQALDLPDMAQLTLIASSEYANDGTFTIGKEIKFDLEQDKKRLNMFMGSIAGAEPQFKANGEALFHVRCFDQSHLMTRGRASKTYTQVKDSDVASTIARSYGWGTDVVATDIVYDQLSQHNMSDLDFLRFRATRIGYQVGVNDKKLYFKPKGQPIRPGGGATTIDLERPKSLSKFVARLSSAAQPKKVIVRGWDAATKKHVIGEASHSDKAPQTKMGQAGGGPAGKFDAPAELSIHDNGIYSQKEAEIVAQAKLDQLATNFIVADGFTAGNPSLQPGARVKVDGTGDFDGTYTVADTKHSFTRSGYETRFSVGHGAPEAGPTSDSKSSAQKTPFGIGIVADNEDPQGEGRVRVKIPWLDDSMQTFWCRMIVPAAGKDRGFFWLPEVGDEVMLAFEHGDLARPYIIGCLWNGVDTPPKKNSDVKSGSKVTKRLMKSRSGHVIQFDDTDGNEKVEIEDKNGNKIVFECQTDKLTIEFAGDIDVTSKKNINIKASMGVSIEAGTTFSAKGNATASLESSGMTTVKGTTTQIQGTPVTVNTSLAVM